MACRILVPWLGLTSGHHTEHTKSLQLEHPGIPRDYLVSKISSHSESLDFTWSRKGSRKLTCMESELEVLVLFLLHCTYSALFWQYQRPQILISSPSYYVLCLNWHYGLMLVHNNRGRKASRVPNSGSNVHISITMNSSSCSLYLKWLLDERKEIQLS